MSAPTRGEVRQWGVSLGYPLPNVGTLPHALIERWNREHPDRPFVERAVHPRPAPRRVRQPASRMAPGP